MGKRTAILTAGVALLLALGACTTAPGRTQVMQADAGEAEACEVATGSRIRPRKQNSCQPNRPLRTYTQDQLDATGEIDLLEALRQLDPVFR